MPRLGLPTLQDEERPLGLGLGVLNYFFKISDNFYTIVAKQLSDSFCDLTLSYNTRMFSDPRFQIC